MISFVFPFARVGFPRQYTSERFSSFLFYLFLFSLFPICSSSSLNLLLLSYFSRFPCFLLSLSKSFIWSGFWRGWGFVRGYLKFLCLLLLLLHFCVSASSWSPAMGMGAGFGKHNKLGFSHMVPVGWWERGGEEDDGRDHFCALSWAQKKT